MDVCRDAHVCLATRLPLLNTPDVHLRSGHMHEQGPHNQAKAYTLQNLETLPTCVRPVKVVMRRRPTVRPPRSSSDALTVGLLTLPAAHQKTYQFPAYQFPTYQSPAYQFPTYQFQHLSI